MTANNEIIDMAKQPNSEASQSSPTPRTYAVDAFDYSMFTTYGVERLQYVVALIAIVIGAVGCIYVTLYVFASPSAHAASINAPGMLLSMQYVLMIGLMLKFVGFFTQDKVEKFARKNNLSCYKGEVLPQLGLSSSVLFSSKRKGTFWHTVYPKSSFADRIDIQAFENSQKDLKPSIMLGVYEYVVSPTNSLIFNKSELVAFVMVRLGRSVPHVVLDSTKNNLFYTTDMSEKVKRSDRMSLEGDFDRYFTTYAPRETGAMALELLTPDVMQMLADKLSRYNVEIVDDYAVAYHRIKGNRKLSATIMQGLLQAGAFLQYEVGKQARSYSGLSTQEKHFASLALRRNWVRSVMVSAAACLIVVHTFAISLASDTGLIAAVVISCFSIPAAVLINMLR